MPTSKIKVEYILNRESPEPNPYRLHAKELCKSGDISTDWLAWKMRLGTDIGSQSIHNCNSKSYKTVDGDKKQGLVRQLPL